MTISLLPDELRKREEEEKQKTKQAQDLPKFKLHLPEERKANGTEQKEEKKEEMEFGGEETPVMKKGVFKVVKHDNLPPTPSPPDRRTGLPRRERLEPASEKPAAVKAPEKPVKPEKPIKDNFVRMKFPEAVEAGLDEKGTKIIRETTDKIAEIKKPKRLAEFFKKQLAAVKFKKPPAEVNLVSEDYAATVKYEFWRRIRIVSTVVLIFFLLAGAGFFAVKSYKLTLIKRYLELSDEIAKAEAEISSFNTEQAQANRLRERVEVMNVLLKHHIYWTKVFDFLEHNIAENVYFTNFSAENSGAAILTGAAKSYADVGKQLFIFENSDLVSSVAINSAAKKFKTGEEAASAEIEFNAAIKFKEGAFKK